MASFIKTVDEAVHSLARAYISDISESSIERIMNHVLMATLDAIAHERNESADAVYSTLKRLMNAKEETDPVDCSSMPGTNKASIEHSWFFRKLWGWNETI